MFEDYLTVFTGVTDFMPKLERIGINVEVDGDVLVMSSKRPNAIVRI